LNNLTQASNVTVEFVRNTYAVNFSVVNGNGTITAKVDNASIAYGALIEYDKDVVFTATPSSGFRVKEWRNGSTVVPGNITNSYTLYHLANTATVYVEFEPDTWAVNFNATGTAGGTITAKVNNNTINNGEKVLRGNNIVFTASPADQCTRVKQWISNGSVVQGNTSNSYTLTNIDANATITVEFEIAPCSAVSFNVVNGNGTLRATVDGTVITSGTSVPNGKSVAFTATPNTGYRVKEWRSGGSVVSGNTSNNYTLNNLAAATTVTVDFELLPLAQHLVSFSVVNNIGGTLTAMVGNVTILSGESVEAGKNVIFTATPFTGYHIKGWTPANNPVTNPTYTMTNIQASQNITVEFAINTYTVNFNTASAHGSIGATVEGSTITTGASVEHGKNVMFTVVPVDGYQVSEWQIGGKVVGDKSNSYTLTNLSEITSVTVVFEPIKYSVKFNIAGGNGTLTATDNGAPINTGAVVQHGNKVEFKAEPATGYRIKEWRDNGNAVNGTNATYPINSYTVAHTVTVEFEPLFYTVTFNVQGGNGTLAATVDDLPVKTGDLVQYGKNVVFKAAPNANYRVLEWKLGSGVVGDKSNSYTLSGISAASTVTVEFEMITYTVSYSATGSNGTVSATVNGSGISTGVKVQQGNDVVFTANPNNGYSVSAWKLNGGTVPGVTSNNYTLPNLSANAIVTVEFEITTLLLTYSVQGGNGTLTANYNNNATVPYGTKVEFTATPATGYLVKEWLDNGEKVNGTAATYTINNFTVKHNVTVEYIPIFYTVTFNVKGGNGTLAATVDGLPVKTGDQVQHGKNVIFTATPSDNYRVMEWKRDNGDAGDKSNRYTLSGLTAATTVTVEFEMITYTVSYNVTGSNGKVSATVNGSGILTGATVQQGRDIVFSANPDNGYRVSAWKLNGGTVQGNKTNSYTLSNMSANATVTVEFEITTLLLTYSVEGGNGTLTATQNNGSQVQYGNKVEFTATPAAGYLVKGWTDNGETVNGTATTYTINSFTVEHKVTVEYIPIYYPVTFSVKGGNGTLTATVDGQNIKSGDKVQHGKNVIFTATPRDDSYRVKEWIDNNETKNGSAANYPLNSYTMEHNVTVEFEMIAFTVTYNVVGGNGGTLSASVEGSGGISTGETVQKGKDIVFTANPNNGYRVKEWRFNGILVPNNKTNSYTLEYLYTNSTVTVEFEITTLLLTYSVYGGNGTLTASYNNNAMVSYGNPVEFTATPASGYRIKEWKDNDNTVNGTSATYTINRFTVAHHVTVEFEPITYRISFNVNGGNGKLTAKVDGVEISSGDQVANTKSVVFTAEPNVGYRVLEWKRGNDVQDNTANSYTLSGITANTTVTVEFVMVTHTVTYNVTGGNGSLTATVGGSGISSPASVQQGRDIVFMANPNTGFSVKEWKINGKAETGYTANNYTLRSLSGIAEVTVEFEPITLRLRYEVVGGNGMLTATVDNVTIATNNLVEHGKTVQFKATPNEGYRIKSWKDNGEQVNGDNLIYTINGFAAAHTVQVEYERIPYLIVFNTVNNYGTLRATVNGSSIASGNWIPGGSDILFTATPNSGYRVKAWTDNEKAVNGTALTYPINNLAENHTVTVEFELITYKVTFSEGIRATVNGSGILSGDQVRQNRSVVFTATPNTGYRVKEWILNGKTVSDNTSNSLTIPIQDADVNVSVTFEMTTLLLTYQVKGANGTLSAILNGETDIFSNRLVNYNSAIEFTATPNTGYRVKEWIDNGSTVNGTDATYTINSFTVAHNVTVEFEPIPYSIRFNVNGGNGTLRATVDGASISSGAQVSYSKNVVFTARPNTGYCVKEWRDNGSLKDGVASGSNGNETYTISGLNEEHTITVEFVIVTYPVTFNVTGSNGSLAATVDGSGISSDDEVQQGKDIVFMASPEEGYSVKEWIVNKSVAPEYTANNYTLRNLSEAANVTVEFERTTLKLKFEVVGENGTLTASVDQIDFKTDNLVEYGKTVVLKAKPDDGYQIKEWKDNGEKVNGDNTEYTINGFAAGHYVTVEFEPISYPVLFSALNSDGSLTATVNGSPMTSGEWILQGSDIVFTAEPDAGYRVKGWTDNNQPVKGEIGEYDETGGTETYTIKGLDVAHIITVDFELIAYPVTFRAESNGSLSATVDDNMILSGASVQQGKTVVFLASPYSGYSVEKWILNGIEIPEYTAERYTLNDLSKAEDVTVEFAPTILTLNYGVTGENGTLTVNYAGSDDPILSGSLLSYGKTVEFTATPDAGFQVKTWKDNGEIVNGKNTSYTIPDFTTAHHVWVEFEPITYSVTFVVVNGNGALTATVDDVGIHSVAQVQHEKTILFTAEPDEGYRVKEWIYNGTIIDGNTDNTYALPNLSDVATVTVEFEMADYPVIFSVVNGIGAIDALVSGTTPIESGTLVPHGRSIEFTATPIDDYYVVKEWTLNGKVVPGNTTKLYSITLKEDATVTVEFVLRPVTIDTEGLPDGVTGVMYSQTLSATSIEPVTWSIVNGSLPDGLTISEKGEISGVPSKAGDFTFTVKAECTSGSDTKEMYCTIEKGDDISGVEEIQATPLKGYVRGGRLYVSGLIEGKPWSVYAISGMLVYRGIAVSDEVNIPLSAQGVYIIQSEERTLKVSFYGQ